MWLMALLAAPTEHGDTHGEASGEAAKAVFPAFDTSYFPSQLFWLAIFFGGFYLILSRVILPKFAAGLGARSGQISADLEQAAQMNDQAVDAQKALDLRVAQARAKARQTSTDARDAVQAEVNAELARMDVDIAKKLAAADTRIVALRSDAMKNVSQIAADTTETILKRLGNSASKADIAAALKTSKD
jgi:F-type H+-transporting ATPase subunit b